MIRQVSCALRDQSIAEFQTRQRNGLSSQYQVHLVHVPYLSPLHSVKNKWDP